MSFLQASLEDCCAGLGEAAFGLAEATRQWERVLLEWPYCFGTQSGARLGR